MTTLVTETIPLAGRATRVTHGGAGATPVVLLHGGTPGVTPYCSGAHLWGEALDLLAASSRVIAIDSPGAGGSALPDAPLTITSIVTRVLAVLDHFGVDRCHLVGHDLGGLVALTLGLERPTRVAAISVVASPTAAPTGDSSQNITLEQPPEPRFSLPSQRWALERLSYSHLHIDPTLLARCVEAARAAAHREACERMATSDYHAVFAASVAQAKSRLYERVRDDGIGVPVQIVWGSHDPLATIDHGVWLFRIIAAKQRATQFHLLNRTGHLVFRDDPQTFARTIEAFRSGLAPP